MIEGFREDLTLATLADYDRLVTRLRFEAEARASEAEHRGGALQTSSRRLPWIPGRTRQGSAI